MLGQGSMAGLAGNDHVFALLFLFDDIGMTGLADIVAGKGNGMGRRLWNGRAAIVAVLPKAARNDRNSQNHEYSQQYCDDDNEPYEMFYVLEQVRTLRQAPSVILSTNWALYFDT